MLTRCPHCQSTFRVTPEQLKARQGKVRCGECQEVFDAIEHLSEELVQVVVPAAPEPEIAAPVIVAAPTPAPSPAPPVAPPEPEPEPAPEPEPEPEPLPEPEPEPPSETGPETQPQPRRWPWAIGVVLLLFLGSGQLIYQYRIDLSVRVPELRPLLVSACDALGCSVPRPQKPELAAIETSDLAPAEGEQLLLTATLKNRAPFAQEYPHLELTLTDTHDQPLLRKVLQPADWLPAGKRPADGFAAREEVPVKLLLEAPGIPAVGYRLYLFYP